MQGLAIFAFSQYAIAKFLKPQGEQSPAVSKSSVPTFADRPDMTTITNATRIPFYVSPIWEPESKLDISIYVSPSPSLSALDSVPEDTKVLDEKDFTIGDWNENREVSTSIAIPPSVQNNGTLWAHFYVALAGHQIDPHGKDYNTDNAFHFMYPLNQYLPKKKTAKLRNLLDGDDGTETEEEEAPKKAHLASYYHPNVTISVIPDSGVQNYRTVHPAIRRFMQLERTHARDSTGQNGWYYPIFYMNTFWQLKSHMTELNSTVKEVPLRISLNNLKNWKFSVTSSIDDNMKQTQKQAATGGPAPPGGDGSEFEMFKEVLLDTNMYLLATTGIVSVLHMVFEMLAFKNDIVSTPAFCLSQFMLLMRITIGSLAQEEGCGRHFSTNNSCQRLHANCYLPVSSR